MPSDLTRRDFLRLGAAAVPMTALAAGCRGSSPDPLFRISLAEWSLHRTIGAGELTNLDFPRVARRDYGIEAVEYVNTFFREHVEDQPYLQELKDRCEGEGVRSLLVMCDGVGSIGAPDAAERTAAVEGHYPWVAAAKFLGCHSIRVNAASAGSWDEQRDFAADGLQRLTEFAADQEMNVIVENHGGLSSNGAWLSSVIRQVGHSRCGTLPDFGNFQVAPGEWYDRYQGTAELMPFARAVSAKSLDFDEQGSERETDFARMLRVVLDAGYRGYVGIEYEGSTLSEPDGIRATKTLLERVRAELEPAYR